MRYRPGARFLRNKELLISSLTLILGIITSLSLILISNGGFPSIDVNYYSHSIFVRHRGVKDIKNYSDLNEIFSSQPAATFITTKQFYIVEVCNLDDSSCLGFHKSKDGNKSSFERVFNDFIVQGKATYSWLDYVDNSEESLNTSLYCTSEQKSDLFFSNINYIVQNSIKKFDDETIKTYAKAMGLDSKKFQDCISSKKYKDRIERISDLTSSFGMTAQPTFYVFKVGTQQVKTIEGKVESKKLTRLVGTVEAGGDYEKDMRPKFELAVK